jgi:hypothetical protein
MEVHVLSYVLVRLSSAQLIKNFWIHAKKKHPFWEIKFPLITFRQLHKDIVTVSVENRHH